MALEVAQRSRRGGGRGGNPLGGGRAAKSHGEEIVAIIYFIGRNFRIHTFRPSYFLNATPTKFNREYLA